MSSNGISVKWPKSLPGRDIVSEPSCYGMNGNLVTRHCNDSKWSPELKYLEPCLKVVKDFDLNSCPPGYFKISEDNYEYCYEISNPSSWDYPCFKSGGASIITDLSNDEIDSLITGLVASGQSRYFWLPAHRQKSFNPVVWTIPGPNWGRFVDVSGNMPISQSMLRNCLVLDIERKVILTETCDKVYPSLCFYINNHHYPASCPEGYHSFRFMPDKGSCFGIEYSDNIFGLNFEEFSSSKCKFPMVDSKFESLARFIFKKIAEISELPNNEWCWFASSYLQNGSQIYPKMFGISNEDSEIVTEVMIASFEGTINNEGTFSLMNVAAKLQCMACETEMTYNETELMFEYINTDEAMYLTVYFPSGLWKYEPSDKGVRCFSNAKGFVTAINIEDMPHMTVTERLMKFNITYEDVDKVVYKINPVTDRSAQYWCEAHTQNLTLLETRKIIVSPKAGNEHVFSLVIMTQPLENNIGVFPDFEELINNISEIFNAKKTLIMDILNYTETYMKILMHIHVDIIVSSNEEENNLLYTYQMLKSIASSELEEVGITFINITSSTHCLSTTSQDIFVLDWETTLIGQITAPKQFCLQSNGLPVKRQCEGSYLFGSIWGPVDGNCSKNYEASNKTTFLYNVAKGQTSCTDTSQFITHGLNYVLNDTDIIIPADIYYLSMSFQHVLNVAQENDSTVEMGDLQNIAWAMNRVMDLDDEYLRLAQTLNSTNVIVDSVNDIIEIIAQTNNTYDDYFEIQTHYEIAVQPKFIVQISYPFITNISGIALLRQSESDYFTDMMIAPLYLNTSLPDVLKMKNLEVATWVPHNVIQNLKRNINESCEDNSSSDVNYEDIHVLINIFYDDSVFQELQPRDHIINSRIIGISIPGYVSNLVHPVPLVFNELTISDERKTCSYWDFHEHLKSNTPGYWTNDGCYFVVTSNNMTVCKCYHLTHFGQLISIDSNRNPDVIDIKHTKALNIITVVGCFLSLIGIAGIWITAIVFYSWRKKPGTKVLLQLSTAIVLPLIIILVYNLDDTIFIEINGTYIVAENMKGICIVLGAFLHYSILSGFLWMLITAILQFIRYVRVLGVHRPSRFMFKFSLIGWGIPLVPVIAILVLNRENYLPSPVQSDGNNSPICYPTGYYLIYSLLLPIIVILIVNVTLFVSVMYSISRGPDGKMRDVDLDLLGAQLRLSIFLFFLLGLSWLFGILTFTSNILWSYLFCITSTLQGFVLFLYFVICDPNTRSLWITLMKPQFRSSSSRESIVSFNN